MCLMTCPLSCEVLKTEYAALLVSVPVSLAQHLLIVVTQINPFLPFYSPYPCLGKRGHVRKTDNSPYMRGNTTKLREEWRKALRERRGVPRLKQGTGKGPGWLSARAPLDLLSQAMVMSFPCLGNPGPGAKSNLESGVSRVPKPELNVSLCKTASIPSVAIWGALGMASCPLSPPNLKSLHKQLMPVGWKAVALGQVHWLLGNSASQRLSCLICTVEIILTSPDSIQEPGRGSSMKMDRKVLL